MPLVPISELATETVDHVVSLGANYEVAYNLRRHFDFSTPYLFDMWVTEAQGIAKVLQDPDPAQLYDPAQLACDGGFRGDVRNGAFGIAFSHEFARDLTRPDRPIVADYAAHTAKPMERASTMLRQFAAMNERGARILFVRKGRQGEWGNQPQIQAIVDALNTRFPNARFGLLMINVSNRPLLPEAASYVTIDNPPGARWMGDEATWDTKLAALGLRLTPGLHKPFTRPAEVAPAPSAAPVAEKAAPAKKAATRKAPTRKKAAAVPATDEPSAPKASRPRRPRR